MPVSTDKNFKKVPRVYGPQADIAYVEFTTATPPVASDGQGVTGVTRSGAGVFVVTLAATAKSYNVQATVQSTNVNDKIQVTAKSLSARTVEVTCSRNAAGAIAASDLGGVAVVTLSVILRTV